MNVFESKDYPLNYSSDATDIINAMSYKAGNAKIVGSSATRSQQYAGDFDMFEDVKVSSVGLFTKRFKSIVKTLMNTDGVYVGDIKCGDVPDWRVVPDKAEGYSVATAKKKLNTLLQTGIITRAEDNDARGVVGNYATAKKEIKFDVIRWKPSEVEAGFVILRNGKSMTLEEAVMSGGLVKLDVVAWLGTRYVEFAIIYDIYVKGKRVSNTPLNTEKALEEDIQYFKESNPFKYLKRLFSYAKLKGDTALGDKLTPILNSDLGRLYLISSDISVLLYLIENYSALDANHIHRELSGFRMRMGNVYDIPDFLKAEPTFLKTLWKLEHLPVDKSGRKTLEESLTKMKEKVEAILASATKPLLRGLKGGTHKTDFLKDHHLIDKGYSLGELSKISSVPLNILQEVYNRGIGAYSTTPNSVRLKGSFVKNVKAPMSKKLSKEQWAMARVYSFLDGNPKHDNDLRANLKGGIAYDPSKVAPSWEEGLKSGYYKPSANMFYGSPLKQGKTFGIIKNPDAFLNTVSYYTGLNLPTVNGSGFSRDIFIKNQKLDRKRMNAPKAVIDKALADVAKMAKIPLKHKMSAEKASHLHWGENPIEDEQSVCIDLPIIDVPKLRERDVRKKAIFQTVPSMKAEGFRFVDKGCIVVHNGEIITIYITGDDDRALTEGAKHLVALGEQMKEYFPRKKPTFYTKSNIFSRDKDEQQKILKENKKLVSEDRYYGWNALDGMMRYFSGQAKQTVVDYHPRSPEASFDNDFLYNLTYSYNAIYALEKRYAPQIAKYRLLKAETVDKTSAIPGDPIKDLPATSLGASENFASALHDDSGIRGITESILWSKVKAGEHSYFVNDKAKIAFDLSKANAMVLIPPKISHGTASTGEHGGYGFVIITKANQVADTPTNKDWYNAWRRYLAGDAKADFANAKTDNQ